MSTGRHYESSLREEQARETRLRIRQAARSLFVEQGLTQTTMAEIARRAGVSPATVYSNFESKAGIVSAMLQELEESIDLPSHIEEIIAETDPYRQLGLFLKSHVSLFAAGADILRAAMRAIEAPEVASFTEEGDKHRRIAVDTLTGIWEQAGALRPGLTQKQAADRLWLLTTVDGFLNATEQLGWEPDEYETWLFRVTETELLKPS